MNPISLNQGLLRLLPAALLIGIALALLALRLIPGAQPTKGPPSPEQALLLRSERLIRKLGAADETLSLSLQPGGQSSRKEAPAPFVQVDCNTPDGEHLASLNWDRNTGELASLSRQAPSDRDAPDRPLTQAEAEAKALQWLRQLDLLGKEEKAPSVTLGSQAQNLWSFHVRAAKRRIRVTVQRRTGDLLWLVSHPAAVK